MGLEAKGTRIGVLDGLGVVGEPTEITQPQPLTLLAYLALEGPQPRRRLATVFFNHTRSPLNSLSSALTRIRAEHPEWLELDANRVATTLRTDAQDIFEALEAGDRSSAVEQYVGAFLDGVSLRSVGVELEEWIFSQRELLATAVAEAASELAMQELGQGDYAAANLLAEQALAATSHTMPDASVLARCAHVYAATASPNLNRVEQLAEQYGIDLVAEVRLLVGADASHDSFDQPEMGLLGRQDELAALRKAVAGHRLVTIVGMGGVGKTTLAQEFVRQHSAAGSAVRAEWVSLSAVDAHGAPAAILDSLGLDVLEDQGLAGAVGDLAAEQSLLLVLDNIEHLEGIENLLTELLAASSNLNILATSRRRVGIETGCHLTLEGLGTDGPGAGDDSAFRLLVRHAQRTRPGFPVSSEQRSDAYDLCRLVGGLPLALELCAAVLDVVPVGALSADVANAGGDTGMNLGLIDEVLEQSWMLLDVDDRRTLGSLGIFVEFFELESALAIADANVGTLRRLVNQSLVTVVRAGRFTLHPLVRDFLLRKHADTPQWAKLERRHCEFFTERLKQRPQSLEQDIAEVSAAWRWCLRVEQWELLEALAAPVHELLQRTNKLRLADELYSAVLSKIAAGSEYPAVAARIGNCQAWVAWRRGRVDEAERLLAEARRVADPDDRQLGALLLRTEATIATIQGNVAAAEEAYRRALPLAGEAEDRQLVLLLQEGLGECARMQGQYETASTAFRAALDVGREIDDPHVVARSYLLLGAVQRRLAPDRAVVLLTEGHTLAVDNGLIQLACYLKPELGYAYLAHGDFVEAQGWFEEGLSQNASNGEAWLQSFNLTGLGAALAAQGQPVRAREVLADAARAAGKSRDWPTLLEVIIAACRLVLSQSDSSDVHRLLAGVAQHPAAEFAHVEDATALLGDQPPSDPSFEAGTRFDVAVESVLTLLRFG